MDELDDEQHMPEGVESAVWQRLVQARRQKVESEQQVRLFIKYRFHLSSLEVNGSFLFGIWPWKRSLAVHFFCFRKHGPSPI